jgi:signal transduction histidine kinase
VVRDGGPVRAHRSPDRSAAGDRTPVPVGEPVAAARWAALALGVALAGPALRDDEAPLVVAVIVVLVHTAWRTVQPVPAGGAPWGLYLGDAAAVGAALGLSGGTASALLGVALVAVAVAAFGIGWPGGLVAAALAAGAAEAVAAAGPAGAATPSPASLTALAAAAVVPAVARAHLERAEGRSQVLDARSARLAEDNRMLVALSDVGRALPATLDLDELLDLVERQLIEHFDARRLAVLGLEDGRWYPLRVRGLDFGEVLETLPPPLDAAVLSPSALGVDDLGRYTDRGGSGMYARLIADGYDQGLVLVEHDQAARYATRDVELFDGVAEVVAHHIDNARTFGRIRSLAAADERARIARDLHDRLGQWLTYINLEIERINGGFDAPHPELARLQVDVRSAISELREALVELRTTVSAEEPLSVVLREVVERFGQRTGIAVELSVPEDSNLRLSGVVENELLRIVQESLTNIEKHADAETVHINWSVQGGRGILTIEDNGRGFDPDRGIRGTAYGLVGMRERAAAVGAILEIASERGIGTVITVLVGTNEETHQ